MFKRRCKVKAVQKDLNNDQQGAMTLVATTTTSHLKMLKRKNN